MGFKFNPFTSNFDIVVEGSSTWIDPVATRASLPTGVTDGTAAVVLDEDSVFVYDSGADEWHNTRLSLTLYNASTNVEGISIDSSTSSGVTDYRVNIHPASSITPGVVSTSAQTFAGDKTFSGNVIIQQDLTVNGTNTIVNTTNLDVEDANITINKNGTQSSADLADAGLTVEMSDATDVIIGYDSTLSSRWKAGDVGSEVELANVSSTQTLTNKTIDADNNTISNLEHGAEVDNPVSGVHGVTGNIVGTSDSQTLTNKTIDADNNTISNLAHGNEVDNPTSGVHGVTGNVVGTTDTQTLTNKTIDGSSGGTNTINVQSVNSEYDPAGDSVITATNVDGALGELDNQVDVNTTDITNKANTNLGNLSLPTSINQDLIFADGVIGTVQTFNEGAGDSQDLNIKTGTATNNSGNLNLETGTASSIRGNINLNTRSVFYDPNSATHGILGIGSVNVVVPPQSAFGDGINIQNTTVERDLYFSTINNASTNGTNTGNLIFETGNITNAGASGDSGDFIIRTGSNSGSGVRGSIRLIDNSILSASNGYVWTLSNNTTGVGEWAAIPVDSVNGQTGVVVLDANDVSAANQTLSNLTSPTSVNQDLIFNTSTTAILQTVDAGSDSESITVKSGDGPTSSGDLNLETGTSAGTRGDVNLNTNSVNFDPSSSAHGILQIGPTNVVVPPQAAFGAGITIQNSTVERDLYYSTVNNTSANSTNTGNLVFETGNITNVGATGQSGDFIIRTGSNSGSGNRGAIRMIDNSILSASNGYVWTLINNSTGEGGWAVSSAGANTTLSNLSSPTSVNQNLFPSGSETIGDTSNRWGSVWAEFFVSGGNGTEGSYDLQNGSGTNVGNLDASATTPSGTANTIGVYGNVNSSGVSLYTEDEADTNSIYIETGNGTTSSGDIKIVTGTASSGTRGSIDIEGSSLDVTAVETGTGVPIWKKYTVSHIALQAAALTNDIELLSLPAFGVIHNVIIKHSTAFAGIGITAYTLSVGISSNLTKYASAFDVFQATGGGIGQTSNVSDFEDVTSSTSIRLAATSTGANLDQSTAGSVDVYVLWGAME